MENNYTYDECIEIIKDKICTIATAGVKHSGKSTLGEYIKNNKGHIELAFADGIKGILECALHMSKDQLHDQSLKEKIDKFWNHSPREFLKAIGTEMFQDKFMELFPDIGREIWARSVALKMVKLYIKDPYNNKFVITDVRFKHEVDFLNKIGATIIRINRPSVETKIDSHRSESDIKNLKVDHEINNDSNMENMYSQFDELYNKVMPPKRTSHNFNETYIHYKQIASKYLYDKPSYNLVFGLSVLSAVLLTDKCMYRNNK